MSDADSRTGRAEPGRADRRPVLSQPVSGSIRFVGTATTLISVGDITILTDPNFLHRGERAYVGLGLSTRRLTEPAISVDELPPVDFVVLSHHHGDHFDRRAAEGLDKDLPIVTEPHAAKKLRRQGFRLPHALRTWDEWRFDKGAWSATVTSTPGKHAPRAFAHAIPPVMGSIVDFHEQGVYRLRLYITGDTLLHDGLAEIPRRFSPIDICLIHLGGTRVAGILLTMDDRQGVEALRLIAPTTAIPVHFDDYTLFRSPLSAFKTAMEKARLPTEVVYLDRGATYKF